MGGPWEDSPTPLHHTSSPNYIILNHGKTRPRLDPTRLVGGFKLIETYPMCYTFHWQLIVRNDEVCSFKAKRKSNMPPASQQVIHQLTCK